MASPKDATPTTRAANRAALDALPFGDVRDFEDARRGFLGTLPEIEIKNAEGRVVWSLRDYAFLADEHAPPTVHPSLWRQARLNNGERPVPGDRPHLSGPRLRHLEHDADRRRSRPDRRRSADLHGSRARRLGADALEQLGYAAESATWRNAYLLGALELRQGPPRIAARTASPDIVRNMSLDHFFDYLGVRLNGEKADGKRIVINWIFPDVARRYVLNLENSALTYRADRQSDRADATVTLDRAVLNRLVLRELSFADAARRALVGVDGDRSKVAELFTLLDDFALMFPVVEPKPEA